ncbi:MAG TPA: hypothetical protein VFC69_03090 [Dysgonamonadaceae bacterium]|nr:hypothetical protein [Dysgonamonadaceae bacterium]
MSLSPTLSTLVALSTGSDLREERFEYKLQYLDNIVAEELLMKLENLKENNNEI